MTTKRRRENENEIEVRVKRHRSKRSTSEPCLLHDPVNAEKRQVLKRLFGRNSMVEGETSSASETLSRRIWTEPETFSRRLWVEPETSMEYNFDESDMFPEQVAFEEEPEGDDANNEEQQRSAGDDHQDHAYEREGENADPLLDSVPVDLDPERLGFLVCAQETLRFLNRRGFAFEHPVFTRLRSRLLRGMDELAVA